mmetsp:Transcript_3729/g.23411  ORF Transcript_3729/g.23411 Transcript_3729/m.23411 type:complete len:251 (-) Transcript_3729:4728-5480(-)
MDAWKRTRCSGRARHPCRRTRAGGRTGGHGRAPRRQGRHLCHLLAKDGRRRASMELRSVRWIGPVLQLEVHARGRGWNRTRTRRVCAAPSRRKTWCRRPNQGSRACHRRRVDPQRIPSASLPEVHGTLRIGRRRGRTEWDRRRLRPPPPTSDRTRVPSHDTRSVGMGGQRREEFHGSDGCATPSRKKSEGIRHLPGRGALQPQLLAQPGTGRPLRRAHAPRDANGVRRPARHTSRGRAGTVLHPSGMGTA